MLLSDQDDTLVTIVRYDNCKQVCAQLFECHNKISIGTDPEVITELHEKRIEGFPQHPATYLYHESALYIYIFTIIYSKPANDGREYRDIQWNLLWYIYAADTSMIGKVYRKYSPLTVPLFHY